MTTSAKSSRGQSSGTITVHGHARLFDMLRAKSGPTRSGPECRVEFATCVVLSGEDPVAIRNGSLPQSFVTAPTAFDSIHLLLLVSSIPL